MKSLSILSLFAFTSTFAVAQPQSVLPPEKHPENTRPAAALEATETIRQFMLSGGAKRLPQAANEKTADSWVRYLAIAENVSPDEREEALREILDSDPPDALRKVILREISEDPSYQSQQARFVRRYGFYATWFNRFAYSASRVLQGNIQAVGQLFVDATFDVIRRGDTTPAERRLYSLLTKLDAQGRAGREDKEEIARLQQKINKAQAEVDIERAEWALAHDSPEIALFYARGAQGLVPNNDKAAKLQRKAESEMARRRRAGVASAQTGYPDRTPPVEPTSPELLRPVFSRRREELAGLLAHSGARLPPLPGADKADARPPTANEKPDDTASSAAAFAYPGDALLAWMMATLSYHEEGSIEDARGWSAVAKRAGGERTNKTAWLEEHLLDPHFNPDVRLARAEASRRGHVARFIFAGPDTDRERAYAYTSRLAQTWNFFSSIGIFYVFEVMYRAGLSVFSPPPPVEEIYDAEAAFIRAAPGHPEAQDIAKRLAARYEDAGRYDNARAMLDQAGILTPEKSQELFRAEARRLLAQAEQLPLGHPGREPALKKALELAPGTGIAKSAMKELEKKPEPGEKITVEATWSSLKRWLGPPPSGLPGQIQWFDGNAENGEIEDETLLIEAAGVNAQSAQITYAVREGGERKVLQEKVPLSGDGELARWLRFSLAEREQTRRDISQFGRTRLPYEVKGGLGPSGVDFYPKLLPIETKPGDLRLYQN